MSYCWNISIGIYAKKVVAFYRGRDTYRDAFWTKRLPGLSAANLTADLRYLYVHFNGGKT